MPKICLTRRPEEVFVDGPQGGSRPPAPHRRGGGAVGV